MPELVKQSTTRIDLRDDFWVVVKDHLTYGDNISLRKSFMAVDEKGKVSLRSEGAEEANRALIALAVIEWNVTSDGQPVPVTRENIDLLEDEDAQLIIKALDKHYKGASAKKKRQ